MKNKSPIVIIGFLLVRAYLISALIVSYKHIVHAANKLQLYGWEAYATPLAIDGMALFGMILRRVEFNARTRRFGAVLQYGAGFVSLVANIYAGETRGQQAFGIMVVALFVIGEIGLHVMAPAPTVDELIAARQKELAAQRNAARKQQAAARKAAAAAKTQPDPKPAAKPTPKTTDPKPAAKPRPARQKPTVAAAPALVLPSTRHNTRAAPAFA